MTPGISPAEYQARAARAMAEAELATLIRELCAQTGWTGYHTHDSRGSDKGFPDEVPVHPVQRRILYAELKRETTEQSPDQVVWERLLRAAGAEFHLWRPRHWFDGTIRAVLLPPRPARRLPCSTS